MHTDKNSNKYANLGILHIKA